MEALKEKAKAEYGPDVRIVRAEEVTVGGLAGFLAKHHYEILVEVPDRSAPTTDPLPLVAPQLRGLSALLAEADSAEAELHGVELPSVSTSSKRFDELIRGLESVAEPVPRAPAPAADPVHVLSGPGDFIAVVGPRDDALVPAAAMAKALDVEFFHTGGALPPVVGRHIANRQDAMAARAKGVEASVPVVVAFGVGRPGEAFALSHGLRALGADQIWAAVDATRKHEDTVSWVEALEAVLPFFAVAGFSRGDTSTPETINALGLPVRWWEDGQPVQQPLG
ncbi:hypothetical protein [Crystallibacter crystallopoietes]|uniref:hypothetical protein n=1 Tax=Crystallibacter crystallopoietes TaxID=37928 RepID=UPI0002A51960|nr:hypothetical protein [Arthrobacter crystallopoietes]